MTAVTAQLLVAIAQEVEPSFWGGVFATLGSVMGAALIVVLLFDWDNPERSRPDRDQDIMRGPLG